MMASLLVIFFPVLKKIKKNIAERIRKNRPTARVEKSKNSIGQIIATIPKTRVAVIITPPIKFPKIIQSWPFLAA